MSELEKQVDFDIKPEELREYCQYRRRCGDAPGWCRECDQQCEVDLGGKCLIKEPIIATRAR